MSQIRSWRYTPNHDLIRTAVGTIKIPVKIMIRPRGGDFIYSDSEVIEMKSDIEYCKSIGGGGSIRAH